MKRVLARISHKFSAHTHPLSPDFHHQNSRASPCYLDIESHVIERRFFSKICGKWGVIQVFLILLLSGCARHAIPPEITAMRLPSLKPQPQVIPKKEELIIVDAGHGGKDAGASSKRDKYKEKTLTLETAFLVADCLKKLGYKTIMTRNTDIFIPLDKRAEIANSAEANLFVSIHYNFSSSQDAKGVEIYYYKEETKPPSYRIVQSKELGLEVLKKIALLTSASTRGVKQANFAVVRETKMPAILIEAGFLSNPTEREKIRDPKYQHSLAKAIASGIDGFIAAHIKS